MPVSKNGARLGRPASGYGGSGRACGAARRRPSPPRPATGTGVTFRPLPSTTGGGRGGRSATGREAGRRPSKGVRREIRTDGVSTACGQRAAPGDVSISSGITPLPSPKGAGPTLGGPA